MFYCDPCANQTGWPESLAKSTGRCEVCGSCAVCNDLPASILPRPARRKEPANG